MSKKTSTDIRCEIRDQMVEAIKKGTLPWRQPWKAGGLNIGWPQNFQNKRRYTGINPLILMLRGMVNNYQSCNWGTSKAWTTSVGAHVRQGEKATYITLMRQIVIKDKETGEPVKLELSGKPKTIPFMKQFPVFNVDQLQAPDPEVLLDGRGKRSLVATLLGSEGERQNVTTKAELMQIAKKYANCNPKATETREKIALMIHNGIKEKLENLKAIPEVRNSDPDFEPIENLYKMSKASISHGGDKAFYVLGQDRIQLPLKASFDTMSDYYQTASHELIHWVVNGKRITCPPDLTYAFVELVAEIGTCFLNMEMGVPLADKMIEKSQGYLAHWLKSMGDDPKYLFDAASLAGRAVDYLLSFVGRGNPAFVEDAEDSDTLSEKEAA